MTKVIYIVLNLVLIVAIWRAISAYLEGKKVKDEIKQFLIICIFIGAAPGMTKVASNFGVSIVQPINSLVEYVSDEIVNAFAEGK